MNPKPRTTELSLGFSKPCSQSHEAGEIRLTFDMRDSYVPGIFIDVLWKLCVLRCTWRVENFIYKTLKGYQGCRHAHSRQGKESIACKDLLTVSLTDLQQVCVLLKIPSLFKEEPGSSCKVRGLQSSASFSQRCRGTRLTLFGYSFLLRYPSYPVVHQVSRVASLL
ncbi:unnamed protein product [Symbiodinium sp. KB8]|nr:unnamed protein product [Symbiodinium sp. KB8]